ncbi:MAG: hypothetical protein KF744_08970 [Taibaiella sp.]|nr:hypothetical protein [Taibaiella sp.]
MKHLILLLCLVIGSIAAKAEGMKGWYCVVDSAFYVEMQGKKAPNGEAFVADRIIGGYLCPKRFEGVFTEFTGKHFPSFELDTEQVAMLATNEKVLDLKTGELK